MWSYYLPLFLGHSKQRFRPMLKKNFFNQALVIDRCFTNRKYLPVFSYLQDNVHRNATSIIQGMFKVLSEWK